MLAKVHCHLCLPQVVFWEDHTQGIWAIIAEPGEPTRDFPSEREWDHQRWEGLFLFIIFYRSWDNTSWITRSESPGKWLNTFELHTEGERFWLPKWFIMQSWSLHTCHTAQPGRSLYLKADPYLDWISAFLFIGDWLTFDPCISTLFVQNSIYRFDFFTTTWPPCQVSPECSVPPVFCVFFFFTQWGNLRCITALQLCAEWIGT